MNFIDAMLSGFRLYRRARGGRWQRWCVEQGGFTWLRNLQSRPEGVFGTPITEDYDESERTS